MATTAETKAETPTTVTKAKWHCTGDDLLAIRLADRIIHVQQRRVNPCFERDGVCPRPSAANIERLHERLWDLFHVLRTERSRELTPLQMAEIGRVVDLVERANSIYRGLMWAACKKVERYVP